MLLTPRAKQIQRASRIAGRPISDEVASVLAGWNGSSAAWKGFRLNVKAASQIPAVMRLLKRSKAEEDKDDLHAADLDGEDEDEDKDTEDEEDDGKPTRRAGEVRLDDLAAQHRARAAKTGRASTVVQSPAPAPLGRPADDGNPFASLGAAYLRAAGIR